MLYKYKKFILNIGSKLIVDIYTLSRFFKIFNYKERGPISCKYTLKPKNIIFYGGAAHSRNYARFINWYFNDDIIETKYEDKTKRNMIYIDKPVQLFID